MPLTEKDELEVGITRVYAVERKIGRGCYGVVWEVFHPGNGNGKSYACKKILHVKWLRPKVVNVG